MSPPTPDSNQNTCVIWAPFGKLGIATEMVDGSLMVARIDYLPPSAMLVAPANALAQEVERQCKAYLPTPMLFSIYP